VSLPPDAMQFPSGVEAHSVIVATPQVFLQVMLPPDELELAAAAPPPPYEEPPSYNSLPLELQQR
jgi:hypothetical protein